MEGTITIPGQLLAFDADRRLTPSMHAVLLRLGHEIDRVGFKADVEDAVWFTLPAVGLRQVGGDNYWLRQVLNRLLAVRFEGVYRGDPWGAVMVAEWRIEDGGSTVRVLVPPGAVNALRAPQTFAKVEAEALVRLHGAARALYLALADKKRLEFQSHWEFDLSELRQLLGVVGKRSYDRFNNLRQFVLDPAVARINDYGTVAVTMTPVRSGRVVRSVRFDWRWKSLDEAREAAEEADRPALARRKPVATSGDAAPLTDARPVDPDERAAVLARTGARAFVQGGG